MRRLPQRSAARRSSTAAACASSPSSRASVAATGPSSAQPVGAEFLHRHAAREIVHRQPAVGARVAVGRQHVIGARAVVAHRLGRPVPEKHRAGVADRARAARAASRVWMSRCSGAYVSATSSALSQDPARTMQRMSASDCCEYRAGATASASARADCGARPAAPAPRCRVTSIACASGSCSACASRSAATKSASARCRRRSPALRRGRPACRAPRPAGSAATSCLAAVTQALPGPKILATFGMRRGAVGQRGDRLRAADLEHRVDAAQLRGDQHRGIGAAIGARRRAQDRAAGSRPGAPAPPA